ncbi:MAG: type II toxin-antitoxin system VapB family antitoxin [Bryobacteraceae bacterium]|nr:type II toxin-antitoxin system VapB family antitoxin [Bryobacteraceae bacterium]
MLNIKNPEAYELAKKLSARTGETLTEAVIVSLRERLEKQQGGRSAEEVAEILEWTRQMHERMATYPVYDSRSVDEIMEGMYDEHGLPK